MLLLLLLPSLRIKSFLSNGINGHSSVQNTTYTRFDIEATRNKPIHCRAELTGFYVFQMCYQPSDQAASRGRKREKI